MAIMMMAVDGHHCAGASLSYTTKELLIQAQKWETGHEQGGCRQAHKQMCKIHRTEAELD